MTKCIDFNKGKWVKTKTYTEDAYAGFYECKVSAMEPYFSPLSYKINALSVYPNGDFKTYLTKLDLDFISKNFENCEFNIISGYEFWPKELLFPLKEEIEKLYAWKERETDPVIKWAVKIFMNSLYGKTIQTAGDENNTGKLFNPMWASEITAATRIKLLELSLQSPDNIIMLSTDAVHSTVPLSVPSNPALGDFAKDFQGSGVYIMSDIYNLWNEKKQKTKTRGFSVALEKDRATTDVLLKDILQSMVDTTEYKYLTRRVYHLGECLLHNKKRKLSDMNTFTNEEKTFDINADKKRLWNNQFKSGADSLLSNMNSEPIFIGGKK